MSAKIFQLHEGGDFGDEDCLTALNLT